MSIQLNVTRWLERLESAEPLRPGAMRLVWAVCFVACLVFWWFVITALLG